MAISNLYRLASLFLIDDCRRDLVLVLLDDVESSGFPVRVSPYIDFD